MRVAITPEIRRWILTWGEEVEVLRPDHLREAVAEQIRRMGAVYG